MKTISTYLLLFLSSSSICQSFDPLDIYTKHIKLKIKQANVKSRKMYTYSCDKDGNRIDNTKKLIDITIYDKEGNTLINEMNYGNFKFVSEYKYDTRNNLIESRNKENGEINEIQRHIYDENNNIIISKIFDAKENIKSNKLPPITQGNYKMSYDEKGNLQSKSYNHYDSLKHVFISRMLDNENNNLYENKFILNEIGQIKEWFIVDKLHKYERTTRYKYDNKGNRIEENSQILQPKQTQRIVNIYDSSDLQIEQKVYTSNELIQIATYVYEKF